MILFVSLSVFLDICIMASSMSVIILIQPVTQLLNLILGIVSCILKDWSQSIKFKRENEIRLICDSFLWRLILQSSSVLLCALFFLWVLSDIWKPIKKQGTQKWHSGFSSKWGLCPSVNLTNVPFCQPFPLVNLLKCLLPIITGVSRKEFCASVKGGTWMFQWHLPEGMDMAEEMFEQQYLLKQMSNFYHRKLDIP